LPALRRSAAIPRAAAAASARGVEVGQKAPVRVFDQSLGLADVQEETGHGRSIECGAASAVPV
jgi:hypothetical protein